MMDMAPGLTRRQLLHRAGLGAVGLSLAGGLGEVFSGALASTAHAVPPRPPRFHSRADLRIPSLTVSTRKAGISEDPIFIAPYNSPTGQPGAVIADNSGEPIWEHPLPANVIMNFRPQVYRGSPVLTWWEGSIELGHGVGEYVIADAAYRTIRRVQAGYGHRGDLHEFVITPRDTALLTTYEVRHADLRAVGGTRHDTIQDAIFQEIDLATGRVLLEWHSFDSIALEESYSPVEANWDFFHINSVDLDSDGNYLVSGRSTHTVYKIDRSGHILWRLGGKRSDFAMGPGSTFAWQHHVRRQPDGTVTIFDNGSTPAVEARSRGLILDVDEQQMTASLLRQYTHAKILSGSQGSVQLLPSGNVFIGWGEVPRVSEFDEDGRLIFDALLGVDYECYRAFRAPWSGRPAEAPAMAVEGRAGALTVYASWNGATEVHTWRLLAGPLPSDLRPVAATRAAGFESALRSGARMPWYAVQALDRRGATLGYSEPVAVAV
jgi:Arylsulfotransferase (ASST)